MSTSNRVEVEAALAAWREAERALGNAPAESPQQMALRIEVEHRRERYQGAVVASLGQLEELEAAPNEVWERLAGAADPTAADSAGDRPPERALGDRAHLR